MQSSALLLLCGLFAITRACETAIDCSLNGVCSGRSCACDVPWTGSECGVLRRLPAQPGGAYGFAPNVSSWGASILPADDNSSSSSNRTDDDEHFKYHMYVAEMQAGSGLIGWGTNSACVHAVSNDLRAPFARRDVVLGAECHGPVVIRDPSDGAWLLFHQGSGPAGVNVNGSTSSSSSSSSSSFMSHAPSPDGPWAEAAAARPGPCGMPTAAFHPNGTLFMVCENGAFLVSAPSRRGPYADGAALPRGSLNGGWEDPTLWFDRRRNFHILYHVYSLDPYAAGNASVASGHLFSEDGLAWHRSGVQPFDGTVEFADGSSRTFATRERPQLLFADAARTTPSALTSGVSSQPVGSMCDACKQGACSQCKVSPGRDWTYTILQPLATES